jgi:DNA-binding Lrp family transcriptional regulator
MITTLLQSNQGVSTMNAPRTADDIDAALLKALVKNPDATNLALADATGLARNTVRARLARYSAEKTLRPFDRRIDPAFLGFPMQAFIMTTVRQRKLGAICSALGEVPEVLEVHGLSGVADLLVHVVARDADDLYRIAGRILDIEGVKRTVTGLVMGEFVGYQIGQLISSASGRSVELPPRDLRRPGELIGRITRSGTPTRTGRS